MKKIEKILLGGCAYAIVISLIFFLFALISNLTDAKIGIANFFIILFFGMLISVAGFILENASFNKFLRFLLHYFSLFFAFAVVFILNGEISKKGAAAIFSAIVVFTFFYGLIFAVSFPVKKLVRKLEEIYPEKPVEPKNKPTDYVNRFK